MATPSKKQIQLLSDQLTRQVTQNERRKPETRDDLAKMLVAVFAALLIIIIVFGPIYNALLSNQANFDSIRLDIDGLLQSLSTVMGPVIGFVIGYYFKSRS